MVAVRVAEWPQHYQCMAPRASLRALSEAGWTQPFTLRVTMRRGLVDTTLTLDEVRPGEVLTLGGEGVAVRVTSVDESRTQRRCFVVVQPL